MKKMIKLFLLFIILQSACHVQTEEERIRKKTEKALDKLFENPESRDELQGLKTFEHLQDSGRMENGRKAGEWIEYSPDSSSIDETIVIVGKSPQLKDVNPVIIKEEGNYINGEKEGPWTVYWSVRNNSQLLWFRKAVINFKGGKKHGEEVRYHGDGQRPSLKRNWKEGTENGIGRLYNVDPPYNLLQVYNAVEGEFWALEKYYPNGQLKTKFTDTTFEGKKLKYYESFFNNGRLKQTGYYLNGEVLTGKWINYYENGKIKSIENYENDMINGKYQYFHDNGQPWTERIYKEGRLLNVLFSFSRDGKETDKGNFKNGNGTVIIYNEDGELRGTEEYIDGKEQ